MLFPVVSRWSMVLLAYLSPYARPEGGLGQAMTLGVSRQVLAGASLSAGVLSVLILGAPGLVLFAAAAALVWLGSLYFHRRLGGTHRLYPGRHQRSCGDSDPGRGVDVRDSNENVKRGTPACVNNYLADQFLGSRSGQ